MLQRKLFYRFFSFWKLPSFFVHPQKWKKKEINMAPLPIVRIICYFHHRLSTYGLITTNIAAHKMNIQFRRKCSRCHWNAEKKEQENHIHNDFVIIIPFYIRFSPGWTYPTATMVRQYFFFYWKKSRTNEKVERKQNHSINREKNNSISHTAPLK